jgi:hypothetical protein
MGRQLQLNFTPLHVHGDAIRLQTLPFKDSEQLRDLRNQFRTQFAVTRRADQIVALPLVPDATPIGQEKLVSAVEHASLVRPLLEQRLVSLLSANRRPVARYKTTTPCEPITDGYPALPSPAPSHDLAWWSAGAVFCQERPRSLAVCHPSSRLLEKFRHDFRCLNRASCLLS